MENQIEFNKTWESLGIDNDFLFGKVRQDAGQSYKKLKQSYAKNGDGEMDDN